jgi:hypothetical protein
MSKPSKQQLTLKMEAVQPPRNVSKLVSYYAEFAVFTAVTMNKAISGIWYRVGLVRTDVSEERIASIFRVEKPASGQRRP